MKKQSEKIICPKCCKTQSFDIYDMTDPGDTQGSFPVSCDNCEEVFQIDFEFKPFIRERLIESE